ncbi:MAG: desulfoferrodoxin FeS4 iron-binding domain-containing protein [Desulfobacterium sp.]|nr:desulfoferrodoxin FeS4 iron-binding domain-containing protein [Desulfobacteraceae bacterium]MBA3038020.1 desulfoferrodoxin FeS4 iron-binding domain-containing protein [Desulfobacterium sp.]MBU4038060.1 desulfoferrodoxin FeS4 iron-binding domain-containing protein [Pseudomonadota bacterium]
MANQIGKKYTCEACGAVYIVTKGGKGQLVCCGKPMEIKK